MRRWQKGNKNLPCPHCVPGSVLDARNVVANNRDTGANKSIGPQLRRVTWVR